jgi:hypothetical protein
MISTGSIPGESISALVFGHHLLPPSWLHSTAYDVLMIFVAINTIMYGALSVAKILPVPHVTEWFTRTRRAETRSIYPEGDTDRQRPPRR